MSLVALVRHGSHDELGRVLSGRSSGVRLSPAGRAEIEALGTRLARRGDAPPIARLQCSPRPRTCETAAILGARLGLMPEIVPALDEVDFGAWSGAAFDDLAADPDWQRWNTARGTARAPGGETMAEVAARLGAHLDALHAAAGGPVLCVGHADPIRAAIARCLRLDLDHLLRFEIAPASVSWLDTDGQSGGYVLTVNGTE